MEQSIPSEPFPIKSLPSNSKKRQQKNSKSIKMPKILTTIPKRLNKKNKMHKVSNILLNQQLNWEANQIPILHTLNRVLWIHALENTPLPTLVFHSNNSNTINSIGYHTFPKIHTLLVQAQVKFQATANMQIYHLVWIFLQTIHTEITFPTNLKIFSVKSKYKDLLNLST